MAAGHGIAKESRSVREAQYVQTVDVRRSRTQGSRSGRTRNPGPQGNRFQGSRSRSSKYQGSGPRNGRPMRVQNISLHNNRFRSERERKAHIRRKRLRMKRRRTALLFICAMLFLSIAFSVLLRSHKRSNIDYLLFPKDLIQLLNEDMFDDVGGGGQSNGIGQAVGSRQYITRRGAGLH